MSTLSESIARPTGLKRPAIISLALCTASALLLVLCMPGFGPGWLAWIALVPLLAALRAATARSGFALGFVTGFGFFLGCFYWIKLTSGVHWGDYFVLGAYFATFFGLFGAALAAVSSRSSIPLVLSAPVLWVAVEFLRAHAGFMAFPMALLGHSQYLSPPVIQVAGIAGDYGVSFLVVMVNATMIALVTRRARPLTVAIPVAALLAALGYGALSIDAHTIDDTLRVTVIQGNIAQELKWKRELRDQHLAKHVRLSRESMAAQPAALIVWPESSLPGYLRKHSGMLRLVTSLARELDTYLLVGSAERPKSGAQDFRESHSLNAAYLVSPAGRFAGTYHKTELIPFVEYLPLEGSVPWPARVRAGAGHFVPGPDPAALPLGDRRLAVLICWESIFADHARRLAHGGAEILVNIGNEAWFGASAAARLFLAANVFRAVENRIAVARSVNTGISGFIDPYGRILDTVRDGDRELFVEGFRSLELPVIRVRSFYSIHGDLFARLVVIAALGLLLLALYRLARGGGAPTSS